MKIFVCFIAYILSAAIMFALPASFMTMIYDCNYHDVVTNSAYIFFFTVISLIASGFVIDELYDQIS